MQCDAKDPEWQELAAIAPPFLHPVFFAATSRWFSFDGVPTVVTARADRGHDRRLAAVLPLVRDGGRLVSLRSLHTPRYDVVARPDAIAALWRALRDDHEWHTLELHGIPATSPLATQLAACAANDRFRVEQSLGSRSPYFALDNFEQRLDGRFRRNLKSRRRQLPDLSFERITTADRDALDDMFRLEAAGWKGEAGTAIASDPSTRAFYIELAEQLAPRGALALTFLRSGGRRIAAHFALVDRSTYYLLKPGYDPELAKLGPGHLLVYEAAKDAARRGLTEFDFLGQDMEWKRSWTSLSRQHVTLYVYRPSVHGHARHTLHHVVRPMLGRLRRALAGDARHL